MKARPEIRVKVSWVKGWAEEGHPGRENSMKTKESHADPLNLSTESRNDVTGVQAGGRTRALAMFRELEVLGDFGGCIRIEVKLQ